MLTYILYGVIALGIFLIVFFLFIRKTNEPTTTKRDIMLVIAGVLVIGAGAALFVLPVSSEMASEADLFFEKLKKSEFSAAHAMTATAFQRATTVDQLAQFSEMLTFDKLAETSYPKWGIENELGYLEGNITYTDGAVQPVRVEFVKEGGSWKVFHVTPQSGAQMESRPSTSISATPEPLEAQVAPSEDAAKALVNESIIMLADAIAKRDFADFYAYSSAMWQSQTTKEELLRAFQEFIDKKIDLIRTQNETLTIQPPKVDLQNALNIDAEWSTKPFRTVGNFRYVMENDKWKLIGVAVNLKE